MISCLIPAYNEEKYIKSTLENIINSKICNEIIVIDDGSSDKTSQIVKNFNSIKLIKNKSNIGKSKSILRGLENSIGNIILLVDADLQGLNRKNLEKLINPIKNNEVDITIASNIPFVLKQFSGLRCLKREVFNLLDKNEINNSNYGFEIILNEVISKYNLRFKYIKMNGIKNVHKIKKYGLILGLKLTLKMYLEIFLIFFKNRKLLQ